MGAGKKYILCAANHYLDGKKYEHQPVNITTGFVVCGRRHHNIFAVLGQVYGQHLKNIQEIQGFLTSDDRFVDRIEAADIAFAAGQIPELISRLHSEDLY